jgi:hypothetical protein
VLAAACSVSDTTPSSGVAEDGAAALEVDESIPPLQPDGALRGIAFGDRLRPDGGVARPRLGFTTEDTVVTAVVGLGSEVAEGSTLAVAWYRLVGVDGREHLFTHEVTVGPGGIAFSEGVADTGLAPGLYETVAFLDGRQVRTPWVVQMLDGPSHAKAGRSSLEDWELPSAGESGWDDGVAPAPEATLVDTCEVTSITPGTIPMRDVKASGWWVGPCTELTLSATVSGPPVAIGSLQEFTNPLGEVLPSGPYGQVDVCTLPGGSDLPGTIVRFEVTGNASATLDYPLPDLSDALVVAIEAEPADGSRVEAGDRIGLRSMAMQMPPSQGIQVLYLDDGSELIGSVGNASGTDRPIPCDLGRHFASLVAEYVVPAAPPPVVEICGYATGFDGARASGCVRFFTGEVWTGTLSVEGRFGPPVDCDVVWEGQVRISVGADGTIAGDGEVRPGRSSCPADASAGPITIAGVRGEDGFEVTYSRAEGHGCEAVFCFGGGPATIPLVDDVTARGTSEYDTGLGTVFVSSWSLSCEACGSP